MIFKNPSRRLLVFCWVLLVLLAVGTLFSGQATSLNRLPPLLILSLGILTWVKAMLVLRYYLNLKSASRGWNRAFNSYLFIILAILTSIFVLGKI